MQHLMNITSCRIYRGNYTIHINVPSLFHVSTKGLKFAYKNLHSGFILIHSSIVYRQSQPFAYMWYKMFQHCFILVQEVSKLFHVGTKGFIIVSCFAHRVGQKLMTSKHTWQNLLKWNVNETFCMKTSNFLYKYETMILHLQLPRIINMPQCHLIHFVWILESNLDILTSLF